MVDSRSAPMFLSDEVDERSRGHLGVAGHVPRGGEHHRAGEGLGEAGDVLDRRRERDARRGGSSA